MSIVWQHPFSIIPKSTLIIGTSFIIVSMSVSPALTYTGLIPKRPDNLGAPNQAFKFDNFLDRLTGGIKGITIAAIGTIRAACCSCRSVCRSCANDSGFSKRTGLHQHPFIASVYLSHIKSTCISYASRKLWDWKSHQPWTWSKFNQAICLSTSEKCLPCRMWEEQWGKGYVGKCDGFLQFSKNKGSPALNLRQIQSSHLPFYLRKMLAL